MPDDGRLLATALPQAAPRAPAPPPAPLRPWAGRLVRLALGGALVGTAAVFLHDRFLVLEARQAVLDGALVTLRAPIEGVLLAAPAAPGTVLPAGQVLASVRNPRPDETRLSDLRHRQRLAAAEAALIDRRILDLEAERAAALRHAEAFLAARAAILQARRQEAVSAQAAAEARAQEALGALRRSESLAAAGAQSVALLDAARRAHAVAQAELRAAEDRRALAEAELRATADGVLASDASQDRSASQAAADRLRLSLLELEAMRAEAALRAEALAHQLHEEQLRFANLREAPLAAPVQARLLRTLARNGEHVRPGQELALLADCAQPEVVAAVEPRIFRALVQGRPASFHDAAGTVRQGLVVALRASAPDASGAGGRYEVTVRLEADPADAEACGSGRLGRLRFH